MLYKLDDADCSGGSFSSPSSRRFPQHAQGRPAELREFVAGAPANVGSCCAGAAIYLDETEGRSKERG